jgi:hypothetical protein
MPEGGDVASTDAPTVKDVVPDVIIDPKNCVPPGSPDYCSPGGGQCVMAGPGGTIEDCTADLPGTVAHDWYCTLPCSKPEDCSGGSSCTFTPMGSRCVPKSCDYLIPDSEAPTESLTRRSTLGWTAARRMVVRATRTTDALGGDASARLTAR